MIRKNPMSILPRVVPRRVSLLVSHGPIGAMLEQEIDHLGLAVQSSFHQWGEPQAAGALPSVHGRAPLEEQASDENRARRRRGVQRHDAHVIRGCRIDPRTARAAN